METRLAAKVFMTDKPMEARVIESEITRACQFVGFSNIGRALERSPAWVTSFFREESSLSLEGIARLLAAAELAVAPKSGDQVFVDELAARALRQMNERIGSHAPLGETVTLTDEEYYQLKQLAQYGARLLFDRIQTVESRLDLPNLKSVA